MNLEFLIRRKPDWRTELKSILFTKGSIVKRGEVAEKKVDECVDTWPPFHLTRFKRRQLVIKPASCPMIL